MEVDTELIIFKEWHIVLTNQEFMWLLKQNLMWFHTMLEESMEGFRTL